MLDDPSTARSPRIARLLLASTVAVAIGTAALSVHLVSGAVEERVQAEIAQTANLLGGSGFPLVDASLERLAGFVGAEVAATDADRALVAASLAGDARADFEAALRLQALPAPSPDGKVKVVPVTIGPFRYTVGVAATPGARRGSPAGAVYVLYDANLLADASRRAWLPVSVMAALATVLAAFLGIAGERRVLSARNGALLRLLAAVAHEVRNPLGAIRAIARTQARAAGRRDAVDPAKLELIAAETERLALLVDGLKNVGRPVQTVLAPISLDGAVRATLDLVGHLLSHRRVVLDVELGAAAAVGLADATQVRQIVLNLVTNAADAQPKGGVIHVTTRALRADAGGVWELVVEDEGPGVPEAARPRLFEPFFSTRAKGLGVGLYLSRRLAHAHGGDLTLAPPGAARGARFTLTLPWRPELADQAPAPVVLPRPSGRLSIQGDLPR